MAIRFACKICDRKLKVDDDLGGLMVACPYCDAQLEVPRVAEPTQAPAVAPAAPRHLAATGVAPHQLGAAEAASRNSGAAAAGSRRKTGPGEPPLLRPARKIDHDELIDMTAMVDIVFFLLIFFLVTSMNALDASLPLPQPDPQGEAAGASTSLSDFEADEEYIVVHIDRGDAIRVGGIEVHSARELTFKLRDLRDASPKANKMLVVASGDASNGATVTVLDAGYEVGMERVRLAVADEDE